MNKVLIGLFAVFLIFGLTNFVSANPPKDDSLNVVEEGGWDADGGVIGIGGEPLDDGPENGKLGFPYIELEEHGWGGEQD